MVVSDGLEIAQLPGVTVIHQVVESLDDLAADLTLEGIFIRSDDPLPVGSLIVLKLHTAEGWKLFEGVGRVVEVRTRGSGERAGMGVQFIDLDPASRHFVNEVIAEETQER